MPKNAPAPTIPTEAEPTCPDCNSDQIDEDGDCAECAIHNYQQRQLDEHLDPGGEGAREADGDQNRVWGQKSLCDLCGEKAAEDLRYYPTQFSTRHLPAKLCECCEAMIVSGKFFGFKIEGCSTETKDELTDLMGSPDYVQLFGALLNAIASGDRSAAAMLANKATLRPSDLEGADSA